MQLDRIKPLGKTVFLEALSEEVSEGGIIIPLEAQSRYPQVARVIAVGPQCVEGLKPGDFAVLVDEGCDIGLSYWQVCELTLKDWPELVHCDIEVWPVIREAWHAYKANPSTDDKQVRVQAIEGDGLTFLTSDILDIGLTDLSNPTLKLEYVAVKMLWLEKDGLSRLFYFAHEDQIILTLEYV